MIDETWTVEEIEDAAALDDLEGAGQAKRMTARLCAELHNALSTYAWMTRGESGSSPPKRMDETVFLPFHQSPEEVAKQEVQQQQRVVQNLHDHLMAACGF